MSEEPKIKAYTNEPFLKSEHLKRDGNYVTPKLNVTGVLTGVPMVRKGKEYFGVALVFSGQEKVLGLNATNEGLMAVLAGDSRPEKWVGHSVTLEAREVNSQGVKGATEHGIRIRTPEGTKLRSGLRNHLGKAIQPHPARDAAK